MIWTLHWHGNWRWVLSENGTDCTIFSDGCSTYCFQAIWWMTNLMIINGMFFFLMICWIKMQWCNSNYNKVRSFWMVSRVFYSKLALLCFIMAEELCLNHAVVKVTMTSSTYSYIMIFLSAISAVRWVVIFLLAISNSFFTPLIKLANIFYQAFSELVFQIISVSECSIF